MNTNLEMVRQIALLLPQVEERSSFGTPIFCVKNKLLARLRDNNTILVLAMDMVERDVRIEVEPETYYVTAHHVGRPFVLIRLANIEQDELRDLMVRAWQRVAPKRLVEAYRRDQKNSSSNL
ncbi:MAG: MmcQ/YjbR family DNA-binding protein [Anaerolineae bacterium]|nr:MmcQ/YjbR family DNA-binding protein [Anaerolineae bacterium]